MAQDAPDVTSEDLGGNFGTRVPNEESSPQNGAEQKPESFSREYVEKLREEAKESRLKAQRADWWQTEARRLAIREATRGVLTSPEALTWDDAWATEDSVDHDAIRAAAENLARTSPWLARPRGPLPGQGEHGTGAAPVSLSALLRT